MKKILRLIPIIILTLSLTGCYTNIINLNDETGGGNTENGGGTNNDSDLVIPDRTQLSLQLTAESKVCEVTFTAKRDWSLNYSDDQAQSWVVVSPLHSTNNEGGVFTLSIFVDENTSGGDRSTELRLMCGGAMEPIFVYQSGAYADGTQPQPYEKDEYKYIVNNINVKEYLDGIANQYKTEWNIIYNYDDEYIMAMEASLMDDFSFNIGKENIYNHNYTFIEHETYGDIVLDNRYDVVFRQSSEVRVNNCNFISSQMLREFNYQNESNPEPTLSEKVYLYSNYRLILEKNGNNTKEYRWLNENMIEQIDGGSSVAQFAYNEHINNITNVDFNTFLNGDMYATMGLLGKRSKNLVSSITDNKGNSYSFDYSFDTEGRIQTITRTYTFNGIPTSESTVFTILYIN